MANDTVKQTNHKTVTVESVYSALEAAGLGAFIPLCKQSLESHKDYNRLKRQETRKSKKSLDSVLVPMKRPGEEEEESSSERIHPSNLEKIPRHDSPEPMEDEEDSFNQQQQHQEEEEEEDSIQLEDSIMEREDSIQHEDSMEGHSNADFV